MGGLLYNLFGSYAVPFLTSTGTGTLAAILALTLPSPRRLSVPTPQVAWQAGWEPGSGRSISTSRLPEYAGD